MALVNMWQSHFVTCVPWHTTCVYTPLHYTCIPHPHPKPSERDAASCMQRQCLPQLCCVVRKILCV